MSAIFPYVGFNYSSSAPCLGGLPILRSPKKLSGQGIREAISRRETGSEQNSLASGNGNNPEQTAAPLDKNSAEVAQADTEHKKGRRRLDEQIEFLISRIPKKLRYLCLAGALALAFSLPSCAFDEYSKRAQNTGSPQTQEVVQPYVGNGELGVYVPLKATDVPHEANRRGFLYSNLTTTPPPAALGN